MPKTRPVKTDPSIQQIADLKEQLARSLADYSNLEKRIDSQRQLFITLTVTAIISQLIDVLDDLNRTQDHLHDPGLQLSIDKFNAVFKNQGVEEIKAENQEFDPQLMDCVQVAPGKQNYVVTISRKGYKLNDQILRPAQVVVGKEEPKA